MTERLRLRPFRLTDASEVQRLAGVREIAGTTAAIPHPYEDGMAVAWINGHDEDFRRGSDFHWAVTLQENDALVGAISLMDVDKGADQAELGYWIGVEHWNNGFCTEAARAVVDWAFESLGLNRVHAHHFSRNPASGVVLKNAGMRHEGSRRQHFTRWGRREDIELYGVLASDWRG
ncbi:MAG: GNAT family N-acetyltransferase [Acidobacteria bacterium]|nr:GNAT family N-acetyltransferase [Acidobacteriota bacterium]